MKAADLQLQVDRCLVIPDVHLDIGWVRRILEKETAWDHLVFLGDYFDSFRKPPEVGGVRETARYLRELKELHGDRMTMLLGNHDLHYLEARPSCELRRNPRGLRTRCSGYSNNAAHKVNKEWDRAFWQACRLFVVVNGYFISHAGLARRFWYPDRSEAEALEALEEHARIALADLAHQAFPLFAAGAVRGGPEPTGGITWLDWDHEFEEDAIPFPQIVGHTPKTGQPRCRGENWCLDGNQTVYGKLIGGRMEIGMVRV